MYKYFKNLLDYTFSAILFILLCPLFLILILLIFLNMGRPIFFSQKRGGLNNTVFRIYKFRTMTNKYDQFGELLPDNKRITKFGSFLRESSLDELPTLLNVLKGDMSFIGPRPFISKYLTLYNNFQKKRHLIKPGITGWAQISGRNKISWEEKFELDVWYVKNYSFLLDLKILLLTFIKVIKKEGVNQDQQTTMNEFKGN